MIVRGRHRVGEENLNENPIFLTTDSNPQLSFRLSRPINLICRLLLSIDNLGYNYLVKGIKVGNNDHHRCESR